MYVRKRKKRSQNTSGNRKELSAELVPRERKKELIRKIKSVYRDQ